LVDDHAQEALFIYWGEPNVQGDAVYYAPLPTAAIDETKKGSKSLRMPVPEKLDDGNWQTPIGNACLYGKQSTWVITTAKDPRRRKTHIWVAFGDGFQNLADLTAQNAGSKSQTVCGVSLVPGYFGKEWNLVVVYRGPDAQLHELRQLSKVEKLVEDLASQLAVALDDKTKAEAEAKRYKADKEALEKTVVPLTEDNTKLAAERDKYKEEKLWMQKSLSSKGR
jgi:hypothetical protein